MQPEETQHNITLGTSGVYQILHGNAPPHRVKKSIAIAGVLAAPLQFLVGRGDIENTTAHLLIDNDGGKLTLTIGDTDPETTHVIKGSLSPDKNLAAFGVNTEKRYGTKELLQFVRMMRYYFAEESQVNELIAGLQNFEGSVTKAFQEKSDPGGDATYHLEQRVNGIKLLRKFKLKVPIFKGYNAQTFNVEIGFDVTSSRTVSMFLFSDELYMLEPEVRAELMDSELAKFADYTFARVVIS